MMISGHRRDAWATPGVGRAAVPRASYRGVFRLTARVPVSLIAHIGAAEIGHLRGERGHPCPERQIMAKRQRSGAVEPTELEVSEARKAFERLESALKGLSPGELVAPRVDVQRAAAIAFSIAVRDGGAERRAKFVKLAEAGFFEIAALDELRTRALAAWYARAEQVRISSLSSDAKVPEPVLRDAMELRGRMLRMLGYFFDDDAELGPEIAVIRRGSGYQDLANDLLAMADLYERDTVRAVVTRDPKNYREGDVASARTYAQTIFRALGLAESDDAQRWASNTQRAWTLLLRGYEETRAAAGVLFQDEDLSLSYPSLVAAARAPSTRRNPPQPEPPAPSAP